MFHTKNKNGLNNICGKKIRDFRKSQPTKYSQRMLADEMQRNGIDMDKNIIQRIESGERFVTDIELQAFSKILGLSYVDLLNDDLFDF